MADQDSILKILVQMGVVGKDQVEAAKESLRGMAPLTDELSEKTKKFARSLEENGEGFKLFETHGREAHKLIHELDKVVPGLGLVFRAAFNPATLGIAAVVLAFELVRKHIEAAKKEAEELAKKLDEANTKSWDAHIESLKAVNEAAGKYGETLDKIYEGQVKLKEEEESRLKTSEALLKATKMMLDAEEKIEIGRAQGDKAKEQIIKDRYAELKRETELNEAGMQLDIKRLALSEAVRQAEERRKTSDEAEAAYQSALAGEKTGAPILANRLAQARAEQAAYQRALLEEKLRMFPGSSTDEVENRFKTIIDNIVRWQQEAEGKVTVAQTTLTTATTKLQEAVNEVDAKTKEIAITASTQGITDTASGKAAALGGVGQIIARARQLAIDAGTHPLSAEDQNIIRLIATSEGFVGKAGTQAQWIQAAERFIIAHTNTSQAMADALKRMADVVENGNAGIWDAINRITKTTDSLAHRTDSTPY